MNTTELNKELKVLIADDDKDDWYFVDLAFKELGTGHKIHFVINGEELMRRLENIHSSGMEEMPDLILLDLNMPKKDGREALKEIRNDSRFTDLNIIIYSTTISDQDKEYTRSLGVSQHITKPSDFSELVRLLRDISEAVAIA